MTFFGQRQHFARKTYWGEIKNWLLHVTKQYVNPLIIIDGTKRQVPKTKVTPPIYYYVYEKWT